MTLLLVVLPIHAFASESEQEVRLEILPAESLFNIENMKPGDWAPRTIQVRNSGLQDLQYGVTLENTGADTLFNEIYLEIADEESNLYDGKLADFTSLPIRELPTTKQEDLHITLRFPEHLGNEYQGLDVHFSLIFTAEDLKGSKDSIMIDSKVGTDNGQREGSLLPKTATNIFTLAFIGIILTTSGALLVLFNRTKTTYEK